jgi:hypothetical protein
MLRIYELIINKFGILHHLSVSQLNRVKRLGVKPRGTHVTYSVNQRQLPPTTPQPWGDVHGRLLAALRYPPDETTERANAAQRRFDTLSDRALSADRDKSHPE